MLLISCNSRVNHEEIRKDPERIRKIYNNNCEGINFPSEKDDWKKFEKNNLAIALNVLYAKKEKIYPTYVSKHNSNREKQVIILVIPNEEKRDANSEGREAKSKGLRRWHYLAVKMLSELLRGIISKI